MLRMRRVRPPLVASSSFPVGIPRITTLPGQLLKVHDVHNIARGDAIASPQAVLERSALGCSLSRCDCTDLVQLNHIHVAPTFDPESTAACPAAKGRHRLVGQFGGSFDRHRWVADQSIASVFCHVRTVGRLGDVAHQPVGLRFAGRGRRRRERTI